MNGPSLSIASEPTFTWSVDPPVQVRVGKTRQQIEDNGRNYVDNGGEARAYGDGKASYDAPFNEIKARAMAEKWK